jgi:hypothetical protein
MGAIKILMLPLAALAASITLAACGGSSHPATTPVAVASHTAVPASSAAAVATTPTDASPVGTWNVAYSTNLTDVLGQFSITQDGGFYYITTQTAWRLPDGNCSVPVDKSEGTFSSSGSVAFEGTASVWEPTTCAFAYSSPFTVAMPSSNTMTLDITNATPTAFTLTRVGSVSSAAPSSAAAVAPSPSATECLVPDVMDIGASAAVADVDSAGFHAVVVTTKPFPGNSSTSAANFPAGQLWGTSPSITSRAPCGSNVTLYFQP